MFELLCSPPPALADWAPFPEIGGWECQHDPLSVLAWVEATDADGYAAALLDALDHRGLDQAAQLRLAKQWQRVEAAAAARKLTAVAAFAGPKPDRRDPAAGDPEPDFTDCAVAAELTLSQPAAARMLRVARALATKLPTTRAAMLAGRTSYLSALKVVEAVNAAELTAEQCERFEELLWPECEQLTVGQVGYRVDKALARVIPDSLDEQATRVTREAYLDVSSRDDITKPGTGAGRIIGRGPVLDIVIISVAIDAWARAVKAAGDRRSLDQLRLAAMVEFSKAYLRGELPGAAAPTSHGSVCTINVGVDLPTFTGLRDGAVEILGHGVFLPASTLDELLPDAGLRRLITHPMTGYLLDATPHVYRPGAGFSRHIGLRDVTSAAPGSTVPAARTELDHGTPFDDNGLTIRSNVTALNKRWHDAKTHGGWTVTQNPDQSRTWTSPTGRTYTTTPHDHRLGP